MWLPLSSDTIQKYNLELMLYKDVTVLYIKVKLSLCSQITHVPLSVLIKWQSALFLVWKEW